MIKALQSSYIKVFNKFREMDYYCTKGLEQAVKNREEQAVKNRGDSTSQLDSLQEIQKNLDFIKKRLQKRLVL